MVLKKIIQLKPARNFSLLQQSLLLHTHPILGEVKEEYTLVKSKDGYYAGVFNTQRRELPGYDGRNGGHLKKDFLMMAIKKQMKAMKTFEIVQHMKMLQSIQS